MLRPPLKTPESGSEFGLVSDRNPRLGEIVDPPRDLAPPFLVSVWCTRRRCGRTLPITGGEKIRPPVFKTRANPIGCEDGFVNFAHFRNFGITAKPIRDPAEYPVRPIDDLVLTFFRERTELAVSAFLIVPAPFDGFVDETVEFLDRGLAENTGRRDFQPASAGVSFALLKLDFNSLPTVTRGPV